MIKKIDGAIKIIILSIFTIICLFLIVTAAFKTVSIRGAMEVSYLDDSMMLNAVAVLCFFVLCFILSRVAGNFAKAGSTRVARRTRMTVAAVATVAATVAVLVIAWGVYMDYEQTSDWILCMDYAAELLKGDGSSWVDGYMSVYPFQSGLVLFDAMLLSIFGDGAQFAFMCINGAAYVGLVVLLDECGYLAIGYDKNIYAFVGGVTALFIPFAIYILVCYGIVPGLFLSVASVWCYLKWRSVKFKGIRLPVLMSIFMGFAVCIKNNYLIFMVGLMIIMAYDGVIHRKSRIPGALLTMVLTYVMMTMLVKGAVYLATGERMQAGMPKMAWVAMGMSEDDGVPGWFNNYHQYVYNKNNRDARATVAECCVYVKERLRLLAKKPAVLARFFYRKLTSEWNDPTWETISVQQVMSQGNDGRFEKFEWLWSLYFFVMNYVQVIMDVGLVSYVASCCRRFRCLRLHELMFAAIAIGGFLFFMFWEAKSQYVVPFFYVCIPYAVMGWFWLLRQMNGIL